MQRIFDKRQRNVKAKVKQKIKIEFDYCCAYCGFRSKRLTLDHVLAESKGGMCSWKNLVPACTRCNHSKGSKNLTQWYVASLPFYSEARLQRILNRCGAKIWALPKYPKGFAP